MWCVQSAVKCGCCWRIWCPHKESGIKKGYAKHNETNQNQVWYLKCTSLPGGGSGGGILEANWLIETPKQVRQVPQCQSIKKDLQGKQRQSKTTGTVIRPRAVTDCTWFCTCTYWSGHWVKICCLKSINQILCDLLHYNIMEVQQIWCHIVLLLCFISLDHLSDWASGPL